MFFEDRSAKVVARPGIGADHSPGTSPGSVNGGEAGHGDDRSGILIQQSAQRRIRKILYARNRVYEGVTGMQSFGPWLERMEKRITEKVLGELATEIPPEWYEDDYDAVMSLLAQLARRKPRVEELLMSAKNCNRQAFPHWH